MAKRNTAAECASNKPSDSRPLTKSGSPERTEINNTLRERRQVLRAAAGVMFAGLLAGCTDGSSGAQDTTGDGETSADGWLSETDNYDSVEDMTGNDRITVEVGVKGNNGANAFSPPQSRCRPERR
ncbi:hypothetical protein ACFFQF_01140 [Haladaptatus pallidirubidus]|uniref:hypothetical protein n=1 Tax=Haladaptatus pallidirubidus TaxID=1008152 RepID=UPI0035E8373A